MKRAVLESKPGSGAGGACSLLSSYRPSTLYCSLGSQTFLKTDILLTLLALYSLPSMIGSISFSGLVGGNVMSGAVGRRGSRRRLSFCSLAFLHGKVLALYIFAFESHVRNH